MLVQYNQIIAFKDNIIYLNNGSTHLSENIRVKLPTWGYVPSDGFRKWCFKFNVKIYHLSMACSNGVKSFET